MAKESSSELSSLAAKVMAMGQVGDVYMGNNRVIDFFEAAQRLAGSVLSQDETPGQMPEEAVERAHDAASNEVEPEEGDTPLPNAPNPVLMRVEFINIIMAHAPGKVSYNKAELMVDKILARQMQYYAAMADPQMEADNREQLQVVTEAKGMIEALVRQGGAVAEFMSDRALWQRTAARGRELAAKMEGMFS